MSNRHPLTHGEPAEADADGNASEHRLELAFGVLRDLRHRRDDRSCQFDRRSARKLYVLDLVGERRRASAVSPYEVVINVSRVVGPSFGGVALATSGATACCVVNTLSYVAPVVVPRRLRPSRCRSAGRATEEPSRRC
ncbi:MAG: MFS transporter [Aeromicrobium sp.]